MLTSFCETPTVASSGSVKTFAATVRPRLEPEVPILSYPDGNLAFDFYLDHPVREVNDIDVVRSNLQQPVSGYLLLRQPVWQQHKPQAHDSWCPIVEAGIGQRAFVLLGPCS